MLPTFPSRYWSTIGLLGVFSLAGWSPRFLTGFLVSRHTQVASSARLRCPYRGVTSYARPSQTVPVPSSRSYPRPLLPRTCLDTSGLGSSPFARHYSGNRCFFLLLQVLRCFSSLRLPTLRYNMSSTYWVFPFGDLRIKGYLHLNGAFRSLSRPSSPLRA